MTTSIFIIKPIKYIMRHAALKGKWSTMEMQYRTDVLVIGGGVIGLACAYYLAASGRQVHLLEQETVGWGASHGNCGLLFFSDLPPLCQPGAVKAIRHLLDRQAPLFISPDWDFSKFTWLLRFAAKCNPAHLRRAVIARASMLRLSHRLYREMFANEPVHCDWQRNGVLLVYKDQADMDRYAETNELLTPYGLEAQALSGAEATKLEPCLRPGICGAWYHDIDSHIRPEKLIKALQELVRRKGVNIDEQCGVRVLETAAGRITAAVTARGRYICAGHRCLDAASDQIGRNAGADSGWQRLQHHPATATAIPAHSLLSVWTARGGHLVA